MSFFHNELDFTNKEPSFCYVDLNFAFRWNRINWSKKRTESQKSIWNRISFSVSSMLDVEVKRRRNKALQSFASRFNFANLDSSIATHGTCI